MVDSGQISEKILNKCKKNNFNIKNRYDLRKSIRIDKINLLQTGKIKNIFDDSKIKNKNNQINCDNNSKEIDKNNIS